MFNVIFMLTASTCRFEPEPPPWLYAWMARTSLFRRLYRRCAADLAASLPAGARVLDVGTGPGHLPAYLARIRPDLDLWGLDFASAMIRRARQRHPRTLKWLVADAQSLPFRSGAFDQTVATFSFHIWPRPIVGVQEMVGVLNPGGRAWIYEFRREAAVDDLRQFARDEGLPFILVYLGFKATYRRAALERYVALPQGALERRESLEQLRALEAGMRIDVALVDTLPLGIDTPADLARAREILAPRS